jgi:hypothetical protein
MVFMVFAATMLFSIRKTVREWTQNATYLLRELNMSNNKSKQFGNVNESG